MNETSNTSLHKRRFGEKQNEQNTEDLTLPMHSSENINGSSLRYPSSPVNIFTHALPGISDGWMNVPFGIPNCPLGLEYLASIDKLNVKQTADRQNYFIKNNFGQNVYSATEESSCCTQMLCTERLPVNIKVMDIRKNEVIRMHRPFNLWSFLDSKLSMKIATPVGNVIGWIEHDSNTSSCLIKNQKNETIFRIVCPKQEPPVGGYFELKVLNTNLEEVGYISKFHSASLGMDDTYFGINFDIQLEIRAKALLLGACFITDLVFSLY